MKKIIITFVTLLIVLIAGLFIAEKFFNKTIIEEVSAPINTEPLPIIDIKEQYKDSTYTFVGTIDVPTPCHSLTTSVNPISEGLYEIVITTVSPQEDIMCAQVITPKQYSVSFEAPADIEVIATIDGVLHELSRFVIPEGADISTFELYIKG
jgi:uncharacterized protein YneF (UPF0154 family)